MDFDLIELIQSQSDYESNTKASKNQIDFRVAYVKRLHLDEVFKRRLKEKDTLTAEWKALATPDNIFIYWNTSKKVKSFFGENTSVTPDVELNIFDRIKDVPEAIVKIVYVPFD